MAYDVEGRTALVTGASSGIGAGLAEGLARAGATVGLVARRRDRLAEVLERCRAHAPGSRMWVADLADPEAVEAVAHSARDELGPVDVLVNNAGIPKRRHVTRLDAATVDAVMHLNYSSPVRLTLALLPSMLERGQGRIVNVSSVAATLSSPGEAAYGASKAALAVFSETMAVDLWDTGVKVMVVYPGVVDTELFTLPDNDPFTAEVEAIPVEEAVAAVLEGLAADALEVYVPAWFGDLTPRKAADVAGFLAGTAAYQRARADAAPSGG
ncbi:MAG TPA: SDR family oxidoreductase [Acidimicrobiales bacterium]|nr:SDR family oxidoreductase [Acidimicrobiales bacterium]